MLLSRRHSLGLIGSALFPPLLSAADDRLPDRSGEAQPISAQERRERIENARRLMRVNGLDAIVLTGGTSLVYFTGVRWWNSERLFAVCIPQRGDLLIVSPAFEEDRAREQLEPLLGSSTAADVRVWQEDQNPYGRLAAGFKDRGVSTGRIGIEETVKYVFVEGIAQAAPAATLTTATPVTAGCRSVKSAHELELMRLANQVTLQAYQWAWRRLKPGMTQHGAAHLIASAYEQLGFPGEASVQVGEYSALPHGSAKPQIIHEGEVIVVDDGCEVQGYNSDITRSFVLGNASDKMRRVFDVVHQAQSSALAAARPGVPCESVDFAARRVISDAGYGSDYAHFTHRVGHGIGMDGHEWPYLVRGNKLPLRAGMTFSDEPGIYLRGEFGIRLEDDMYITEEGARLFTPQSASLEQPFAT